MKNLETLCDTNSEFLTMLSPEFVQMPVTAAMRPLLSGQSVRSIFLAISEFLYECRAAYGSHIVDVGGSRAFSVSQLRLPRICI